MKTKLIQCLLVTLIASLVHADPLGTAFTYQGRLNASGSPANGSYDFIFTLYTNSVAGNQIGNPYPTNAVPVSNGLFTVSMDFGNVFNGTAYWLGISVRTNNTGSYLPLSPRQPLAPAPYAVFANTAGNLSGTVSNNQLANNSLTINAGTGLSGGGSVALGNATTLNNAGVTSLTGGGGVTVSAASGTVTLGSTATSANTPNAIVSRDGNGDFTAGDITLANNLYLQGSGVIYSGGSPFIRAPGSFNFFGGIGAGAAGNDNVGIGGSALSQSSGNANTAIGYQAMSGNNTGNANIALGVGAGSQLTTGSHNICIGNPGVAGDDGVIRIGDQNTYDAIIPCIYGDNIASGIPVYINSQGVLGVQTSSARFKQNIQSMGDTSDVLFKLRPVTFQYKPDMDPTGTPQFGLVAEQVEKVDPALVARDAKGKIYTVRYQAVDAMLLNEFLKEHRTVQDQSEQIKQLQQTVAELKVTVNKLMGKGNDNEN